jgi:inorganic triphosphatase YgiF
MADAGTDPREPREFELKLEFDPADKAAIEAHPLLAGSTHKEERLNSIYFDTADLVLQKARLCLRLRDTGRGFVQTIKASDGAQLFDRPEWEEEVPRFEPDLTLAAGTALEPLLNAHVREALQPLFQTRIDRDVYRVDSGGSEIEVAVDRGEIEAAERRAPVHEVELELKRGNPADLFRLAQALAANAPLTLAVKTKAERGYELASRAEPVAEKAERLDLDRGMTCQQAFRTIGESCLRQIVTNAPGVIAGHAESLHQMRIGLRRMRAAIAAFAKVVADAEQDQIKAELKWITNELGRARDLDVFEADILKPIAESRVPDANFAATRLGFDESRAKAYATATAAIRSGRYRHILLDLAEWIEAGPWTSDDELRKKRERSVAEHAAKMLERVSKKIKKAGFNLRELTPKQRHKIRIKAKNLRYAVEFFASLFPDSKDAKRREAALSALKDLQDELGALNDLAQRDALIANGHELGEHAEALLASKESDVDRLLDRAQQVLSRFAEVKPFWREG